MVLVGKWDDSLISRIQQANDIVEVVSEYMSLDKRGKEFVGLCPFHTDHRPSMYVSPVKQIFKCFACSAGGDVLKFIQMKENLTFVQAVERLAQRAGIALPAYKPQHDGHKEGTLSPNVLAKINAWAMNHWTANLWDETKGDAARQYLNKRRISEDTARKWGLGLALDDWSDLVQKGKQDKIPEKVLLEAGLVVRREETSGSYDKFRNRLMFPIADVSGRVVGFGGRTLGQDPAKYMNSPATVLFDKSQLLYGLRQARESIVKANRAVVVEGYTDVMLAHQHGVSMVVAALGTSLTSEHAKVLRRYAERIVLVFDSDTAGRAAANRALEVCLSEKVDIRLAFVPEGKDPCDYVIEAGPKAFEAVIDSAEDVLSFKWKQLTDDLAGQKSLSGRTEAVQQFLKVVALAVQTGRVDSLSLAMLIGRLSGLLQTPKSRIDEELQKLLKQKPLQERTKKQPEQTVEPIHESENAVLRARREIIEVLMCEPALYAEAFKRISLEDFGSDGPLQEIAGVMLSFLEIGKEPELVQLYGRIESPETAALLTELVNVCQTKGAGQRRLEDSLRVLEEQRQKQDIEACKERLTDDATEALRQIEGRLKQQKSRPRNAGLY